MRNVLLSGIDGSGKTSSIEQLQARLERRYRVMRVVNRDGALIRDGVKTRVLPGVHRTLEALRPLSIRTRTYGFFLLLKYLYKASVVRRVLRERDADLCLFEIDVLLHPAVYVTYHFPWTVRVSRARRIRSLRRLFGAGAGTRVFYLDTEPEIAMERIRRRGSEVSPHENTRDLTRLRQEFEHVVAAAREQGFEVTRVDTSERSLVDVVDFIEGQLEKDLAAAD